MSHYFPEALSAWGFVFLCHMQIQKKQHQPINTKQDQLVLSLRSSLETFDNEARHALDCVPLLPGFKNMRVIL